MSSFGVEIIDHCLLSAGIEPSEKVEQFLSSTPQGVVEGQSGTDDRTDGLNDDRVRRLLASISQVFPFTSESIADAVLS